MAGHSFAQCPPESEEQGAAEYGSQNVGGNSGSITDAAGYILKKDLLHRIGWIDVEHINVSKWRHYKIDGGSCEAKETV